MGQPCVVSQFFQGMVCVIREDMGILAHGTRFTSIFSIFDHPTNSVLRVIIVTLLPDSTRC